MPRDQDSLELRTQNTNTKTRTRKQNVAIPPSRISSYRTMLVVCVVLLLDRCEAAHEPSDGGFHRMTEAEQLEYLDNMSDEDLEGADLNPPPWLVNACVSESSISSNSRNPTPSPPPSTTSSNGPAPLYTPVTNDDILGGVARSLWQGNADNYGTQTDKQQKDTVHAFFGNPHHNRSQLETEEKSRTQGPPQPTKPSASSGTGSSAATSRKGKSQVDTAIDNIYYLLKHSDRGGMKGQVPKKIIDDLFVIMKKWSDAKSYGEDTWAYSYPSIKKYVQRLVREHKAIKAQQLEAKHARMEQQRKAEERAKYNNKNRDNKLLTKLFQPFKGKFNKYDFLQETHKELHAETAAEFRTRGGQIDRHPSYKTLNALKSLYLEHGDGLLEYIQNYMHETEKPLQVIISAYRNIWEADKSSTTPRKFLQYMKDNLKQGLNFTMPRKIKEIETRNLNAMNAVFQQHK